MVGRVPIGAVDPGAGGRNRIHEVPHDLAIPGHLENAVAVGEPVGDQRVAVRQPLRVRSDARVERINWFSGVGPNGLARSVDGARIAAIVVAGRLLPEGEDGLDEGGVALGLAAVARASGAGFEAAQSALVQPRLPAVEVGAWDMEDIGGSRGGCAFGADGAPLLQQPQPDGGGGAEFQRAVAGGAIEWDRRRGYLHGASFWV